MELKERESDKVNTLTSGIYSTFSYLGSLIRVPGSSDPISKLNEYDTKMIDGSLINRLDHADKYLEKLYEAEKYAQRQYDNAVLHTKEVESKYENNMEMIQQKIDDIKRKLLDHHNKCAPLIRDIGSSECTNEKVLEYMSSIFDFGEELKSNLCGGQKIFNHIDLKGVQTTVDYCKVVELNKTLLDEIASRREAEIPFKRTMLEIRGKIKKVGDEVALIKKFKTEHSKILSGGNDPVICGEPTKLLDDDQLTIRKR